eukprot:scaffold567605_cov29-Prasinocladus_malaysianus.AAC.1
MHQDYKIDDRPKTVEAVVPICDAASDSFGCILFVFALCSDFQGWADVIAEDLKPSKKTLCLCHHGMRSAQ